MVVEYGLSFAEGRRIVRYPSRDQAEAELARHLNSKLVSRSVSDWESVDD